jgi:hypothetical protein
VERLADVRVRILAVGAPILALSLWCGPSSVSQELAGLTSDEPPARGRPRVSAFGGDAGGAPPAAHVSVFVDGADYSGMEDNDLRGFLDGVFEYGWNQVGQRHLRIGRRAESPRFGEYEILRNLHRWDGIDLPAGAAVTDAVLQLEIEEPAPFAARLMLYEVKQDWYPGGGGTLRNNVSPPLEGEVWWNERAHGRAPWGLPGVGYASESDPAADTAAAPLADALLRPGDAASTWCRATTRTSGASSRRSAKGCARSISIVIRRPFAP